MKTASETHQIGNPNMKLTDMNTGFLEHGLKANPYTTSFPWNTQEWGGNVPRHAIEAELVRREKAAKESEAKLAPILQTWEFAETGQAKPFSPAGEEQDEITVLLFTSHVPSHPDSWLIENVYDSIRHHLPTVRIIVLADGYNGLEPPEYIQFKENIKQKNWEVIEFEKKSHQTLMLRHALLTPGLITTPLVMVAEHDWGLKPLHIDWKGIVETLTVPLSDFSMIELRQDKIGIWEWKDNFFRDPVDVNNLKLMPTTLFQCPTHIARCDWYRRLAYALFIPDFLERDELQLALKVSGAVSEMACYLPAGPIGRLYHLNGREVRWKHQLASIGGI